MTGRRVLEIGGILAGALMIAFGIGALVMSINARSTVSDELKGEQIVGSADMNPTDIAAAMKESGLQNVAVPSCDVAEQPIETGSDARCFAKYMRIHALESSGGLTYAQMGRFVAAKDPTDPAGTSDEAAAAKDEERQAGLECRPQHVGHRDRPRDGAQRLVHGPADRALRADRRDRAAAQRHRLRHPRGDRPRSRSQEGGDSSGGVRACGAGSELSRTCRGRWALVTTE